MDTPLNFDSVDVGPTSALLVGSLAARSKVTRSELVKGENTVEVLVMIVSG